MQQAVQPCKVHTNGCVPFHVHAALKSRHETNRANTRDVLAEKNALHTAVDALNIEVEALKAEINTLKTQIKTLELENSTLQVENKANKIQLDAAKRYNQDLKAKYETQDYKALKHEIQSLKHENEDLRHESTRCKTAAIGAVKDAQRARYSLEQVRRQHPEFLGLAKIEDE